MFYIDFAAIHKVHQALDVFETTVAHQYYWILAVHTARTENRIKVRAARAQHHPMGAQQLSLAGNCHVTEAAAIEKLREHRLQIAVMVFPT